MDENMCTGPTTKRARSQSRDRCLTSSMPEGWLMYQSFMCSAPVGSAWLNHVCAFISSIDIRRSGSATSSRTSRSLHSGVTCDPMRTPGET